MADRLVLVVSPRGDVVRVPDRKAVEAFRRDSRSVFVVTLDGYLDDGTPVIVNASAVSLAWLEDSTTGPQGLPDA